MAEKNTTLLKIITPDRIFYEKPVQMVEFNTTEGEIGVLPGHIPLTTIISPGVLIITEESEKKEAALHAGFVEILPDEVTILAEIIEWPDEIDEKRAQKSLERAEERIRNKEPGTDLMRAEISLKRAMARIEVLK